MLKTTLFTAAFCHHTKTSKYFSSKPVHLARNLFHHNTFCSRRNSQLLRVDNCSACHLLDINSNLKNYSRGLRYFSNSLEMANKPILYSYFRSGASWRLRIALHYKGIDFEYHPVNLLKREQAGEEYLKVNPMGHVPAFVYDGKTVTQSIAIMELLEDLFPSTPLIPKDPFQRAKVREISEVINSGIQPLQNLSVITKVSEDPAKRADWANFWITKGFEAVEKLLEESSGKFCVGNEVTWADCCLVPQVAAALRFKVKVEDFPNILRINDELSKLEAVAKAHAFVQPDCPEELRQK